MNEKSYDIMDQYLNGEMGIEDRRAFELQLSADKDLAASFAVYQAIETEMRARQKFADAEDALKNSLQQLNTRYFSQEKKEVKVIRFSYKRIYKITAAVAAVLIAAFSGYFLLLQSQNPQQLASKYIKNNFLQLSQTMDGARDSVALGIADYNNKQYAEALLLFKAVYQNNPEKIDAKKYTGLVYLMTKDYNNALQEFDELAAKKGLFSNPGLFYEALTLLQRNGPGDKEQAKHLLKEVVNEKAEGSKEAAEWLKQF